MGKKLLGHHTPSKWFLAFSISVLVKISKSFEIFLQIFLNIFFSLPLCLAEMISQCINGGEKWVKQESGCASVISIETKVMPRLNLISK